MSRCSYFEDAKLPLASEIIYLHYITLRGLKILNLGCIHYIVWTQFPLTWVYIPSYVSEMVGAISRALKSSTQNCE